MTMTCASFFAGIGGIDLGFEQTGRFRTVYANDFNPMSVAVFNENFSTQAECRDICTVRAEDIPDADVIMGGFPCQAFSIQGNRQGFSDEKGRGTLFFEMLRIIKAKRPRAVFFENVKNLVYHDNGKTFSAITGALRDAGYACDFRIMNAAEYGNIPQNRERIYIVGFRDTADIERFRFPDPIDLTITVRDIIDFEKKVDEKHYYRPGRVMYEKMAEGIDDPDTVYQWRRSYIRKNKRRLIPTLVACGGGNNTPIVKTAHGIRRMTPAECLRAQGFPDTFRHTGMSDTALYGMAGNSVCVPVVRRIAECMAYAMQDNRATGCAPGLVLEAETVKDRTKSNCQD